MCYRGKEKGETSWSPCAKTLLDLITPLGGASSPQHGGNLDFSCHFMVNLEVYYQQYLQVQVAALLTCILEPGVF